MSDEKESLSPNEEARVKAAQVLSAEQEKFENEGGATTPPEKAEATPEVVVTPPRSIGARIRDVEKRWSKDFEHVLLDIHDHIFGVSDPHDKSDDPLPQNPPKGE
jgi:hypothetical protein